MNKSDWLFLQEAYVSQNHHETPVAARERDYASRATDVEYNLDELKEVAKNYVYRNMGRWAKTTTNTIERLIDEAEDDDQVLDVVIAFSLADNSARMRRLGRRAKSFIDDEHTGIDDRYVNTPDEKRYPYMQD